MSKILKFIFLKENNSILSKVSLKFVDQGPIVIGPKSALAEKHCAKQTPGHYLKQWWPNWPHS